MGNDRRVRLKSSQMGKVIKFTKEFEFDLDIDQIPGDLYKELVKEIVDDLTVVLHSDGEIGIFNDWTIDNSRRVDLLQEVRRFAEGMSDEERRELEVVLRKALEILGGKGCRGE